MLNDRSGSPVKKSVSPLFDQITFCPVGQELGRLHSRDTAANRPQPPVRCPPVPARINRLLSELRR